MFKKNNLIALRTVRRHEGGGKVEHYVAGAAQSRPSQHEEGGPGGRESSWQEERATEAVSGGTAVVVCGGVCVSRVWPVLCGAAPLRNVTQCGGAARDMLETYRFVRPWVHMSCLCLALVVYG